MELSSYPDDCSAVELRNSEIPIEMPSATRLDPPTTTTVRMDDAASGEEWDAATMTKEVTTPSTPPSKAARRRVIVRVQEWEKKPFRVSE